MKKMKQTVLFIVCSLTNIYLFAQLGFNMNNHGKRVALIQADVNLGAPSVTIRFLDNPAANETRSVFRRALFSDNPAWTAIATNLPASVTSYTDNNVSLGSVWEYQVKRNYTGGTAIGYTCAALRYDKTNYRGRMLLVIDNTIATPLALDIKTLKTDLTGDGWLVQEIIANRVAGWDGGVAAAATKQLIVNAYNNAPANDKPTHLFLLGHIPMPRSGRDAFPPDEHDENKGARGADCYYADIDGVYTDNQTYNPGNLVTPLAINLPGDNRFDQDFIPSRLEMAFGRVDFADLQQSYPTISEIELYRRYLEKLHLYKNVDPTFVIPNKCGFNLGYDNSNDGSYRSLIPIAGIDSVKQRTNNQAHPQWVKNNGPFLIYMQNVTVPNISEWQQYGMDAVVFSSDQSYYGFGDVAQSGSYSLIRALLASNTKNLVNLWTTMGINIFHQPAVGETFGFSCKQIMDHNLSNQILEKPEQPYDSTVWWNRTHFAYHGDPTLRFFQVKPATNITQLTNTGQLHLKWNKSSDAILGYHVYKSSTEFGKYDRVTTVPIADTNYIATNYTPGDWYMVRAVKEQKTGSGIFLNASQGIFIQTTAVTNTAIIPFNNKISVWPIPAKNRLQLQLPNNNVPKAVVIYDMSGKKLVQYNNSITIQVQDLKPGTYQLAILYKGKWQSRQFSKE